MLNFSDNRFWNKLIGSKQKFSIQARALHAIIALGALFVSMLLVINVVIGNFSVAIFLAVILVFAPLVHYLSRVLLYHWLAVGSISFLVVGIFVSSFLLKAGTKGPALFLLPITYFILIGFVSKRIRTAFLIFHILLSSSLIIWEYNNPQLSLFSSFNREILFVDILSTVAMGLVLTHVVTTYMLNTFNLEREGLLHASQKIAEQNDQLQALNNEKTKLLGIMSHDLRGSLGALQSLSDLMIEYPLSEEEKEEVVLKIQMQSRLSGSLLDNMLFWAKNQINGTKAIKKAVLLEPLIKELQSSNAILASNKNVLIHSKCDARISAYTDMDYLHLILRNLVQNAVKFTPKGGSVHILVTEEISGCIQILIKDSGVGFETSYLAKIGDSRLESTIGTSGEKGTGLGLLLVYEYVELLGAKIECNSVIDMGTTFKITLPAKPKKQEVFEFTI
jgi:two-component system, sensor histidine kinase and response regulator